MSMKLIAMSEDLMPLPYKLYKHLLPNVRLPYRWVMSIYYVVTKESQRVN